MRRGLNVLAVWAMVLTVWVGGVIVSAEQQPACTITVQPGESIQAAMDAAPVGAVICLAEGEWLENITIKKSLTLRGVGPDETSIRGVREGNPVIRIENGAEIEVWIDGVTVAEAKAGGLRTYEEDGIHAEGRASVTITGSVISGSEWYGISLSGLAQAAIADCTIPGNECCGISLSDSSQATITNCTVSGSRSGILILGSSQATITGCSIPGKMDGIKVEDSAKATITTCSVSGRIRCVLLLDLALATITDCSVSGSWVGISVRGSSQATIAGCSVSASSSGISLKDSTQAAITDCAVSGCRDGLGAGIGVWDTAQATIAGCALFENVYGVFLGGSAQAIIRGNQILRNRGYAVALYEEQCSYFRSPPFFAVFTGRVVGGINTILGQGAGNARALCPDELNFLMTDEGGELDRRK